MLAAMHGEQQCSVLCGKGWDGLLSECHDSSPLPQLIEAKALREMGRGDLPVQVHYHFAVRVGKFAFAVGTQACLLLFPTVFERRLIPQRGERFACRREACAIDQDVQIRHLMQRDITIE